MKISFVIPAYNEEKSLPACLESVYKEIKRNPGISFEVIVADNGSADRTSEVAKKYPGTIVVIETEKGANRARQTGFLKSTGDLLASVDADTVLPEGWVKRALDEFSKRNDLICLSGPFIYYDTSMLTRFLVKIFYFFGLMISLINKHVLRVCSMIQGGNLVVKRSALEKIGGFNTSIKFYGDDTDLARRLNGLGDVRFTFSLPIYASGRRLLGGGAVRTGLVYAANFLSVSYFKKPVSKTYSDFRKNPDGGYSKF